MSSKKGKKVKSVTVSLQEFQLRNESTPSNGQNVIYAPKVASSGSWAQEMEEDDFFVEKERIVLPSAPRASRIHQQMESISHTAPFSAHLGNISYDISEEDVEDFFRDQKIVNLRLPRDGSRLKGYGYVDFETRDDLIEALALDGQVLKGRPLRVSVGTQGTGARGQNEDRRGGGGRYETDDTPDDWRSGGGQVVGSTRQDSFSDDRRGGYGNYGRPNDFGGRSDMIQTRRPNNDWRSGGGQVVGSTRQDSFPDDRRGGGGYGNYGRPNDFGGRNDMMQTRRPNNDWRSGGGQVVSSTRQDSFPDDRMGGHVVGRTRQGSFSDDRAGEGGYGNYGRPNDFGGRNDMMETRRPNNDFDGGRGGGGGRLQDQGEPRERKKLVLTPRTKPLVDEPAVESSTSIFGGAKPVDTAARERVIEEKLKEMEKLTLETNLPPKEGRRNFNDDPNERGGFKGPVRILKRNEGASALPPSNNAMPPLITSNNRRQQRGFSHGRERTTSSDSSQPSSTHRHEEYEKDTNSEPEDERDLRRQQAMRKEQEDEDDDGFIEVQKRRSNHKVGAQASSK